MRTSVGLGQHLIQDAKPGLKLNTSAKLFAYVFLDPANPPQQIMLQWHDRELGTSSVLGRESDFLGKGRIAFASTYGPVTQSWPVDSPGSGCVRSRSG